MKLAQPVARGQQRGHTVDHVVGSVREGILSGRFAPGQRLISRELVFEFGISRGPLREAFRRLAADGLVELTPNRGAAVRRLSRPEVEHLFQIRVALEGLAARLAAEGIDRGGHRAGFSSLWSRIRPNDRARAIICYTADNQAFHRAIVEISGNPQLCDVIDRLQLPVFMFQMRRALPVEDIERSLDEHVAIAEAILAGDPDAADLAMRRHLQRSAASILALPASAFKPDDLA